MGHILVVFHFPYLIKKSVPFEFSFLYASKTPNLLAQSQLGCLLNLFPGFLP